VSLKDIIRHPTLADLAGLVDTRTTQHPKLLHTAS
jgi:hypothetical protein